MVGEHDLELKKMPEARYLIEMNARSAAQKQGAQLLDTADLTIGLSEHVAQSPGAAVGERR